MSGNLGFKVSQGIHSGADTTLAPTNMSAPPLKSVPLDASAYYADPSWSGPRGQTLNPCPNAAPRPAGWRPSEGSVGPSLAELAEMLFTPRRLRTADYEGLKGLSSNFITVQ